MENVWVSPTERCRDAEGDEASLVEAARVDSTAFGALYQRYLVRIYRYLRARTNSKEDAADLTQQVFLKAWDALPGYRERGAPFAAWLARAPGSLVTLSIMEIMMVRL